MDNSACILLVNFLPLSSIFIYELLGLYFSGIPTTWKYPLTRFAHLWLELLGSTDGQVGEVQEAFPAKG